MADKPEKLKELEKRIARLEGMGGEKAIARQHDSG